MDNTDHINWVFDDPTRFKTMSACPDTVHNQDDLSFISGRFPVPNLFWHWKYDDQLRIHGLSDKPSRYCYNIGTWVYPEHWAGYDGNDRGAKNLFELIPSEVLDDARNNRALLVIDNLNEGFQDDRLYEFWHYSCDRYNLPPSCIVYVTSNEAEPVAYASWANDRGIDRRINNIAFCQLEYSQQHCMLNSYTSLSWLNHQNHKGNKTTIKDFNCLNRVNRWHREYFVMKLIDEGLHTNGLISHNKMWLQSWEDFGFPKETIELADSLLPMVIDDPDFDNNKAMHINQKIYLDSWLSVVTETHAADDPKTFFMSEKIWKPMYALHPFMVLGDIGVLARLRSMGYKTFDGLINESYDSACFMERVELIISNLKRIRIIKDKAGWFDECRDVCMHNRRVFTERKFFDSQAYRDLVKLYDGLDG